MYNHKDAQSLLELDSRMMGCENLRRPSRRESFFFRKISFLYNRYIPAQRDWFVVEVGGQLGLRVGHKWLSPAKRSTRLSDFKAFEMTVPLKEDASVRP